MTLRSYWIGVLLIPVLVRWWTIHDRTKRTKLGRGVIVFPALGFSFLCFISVVMGTCLAIAGSHFGGLLMVAIGAGWALFSLWVWPDTIILDDRGLAAIHIWRPTRRMAHAEIDHVARMADKSAIVYGKGAVKQISISEYHVGTMN